MDGRQLGALRRCLNLPLHRVARAIGRSPSWLYFVESGALNGSAVDLERLAAYLREQQQFPIQLAEPRRRK